jgi:hypothetical protein|tara:strand:+ start:136 stop:279 length:144 start_codon:yes stop_codon:yes gene_type:complete
MKKTPYLLNLPKELLQEVKDSSVIQSEGNVSLEFRRLVRLGLKKTTK